MMLEMNRHHYLMFGVILLLLGLQLRQVESFTLSEQSCRFIEQRFGSPAPLASQPLMALLSFSGPPEVGRKIKPPRWLGFSLISVGAVLILQSLAMKKPGT